MQKSSVFGSKGVTGASELPVAFKEKVVIFGVTDAMNTICKKILVTYFSNNGLSTLYAHGNGYELKPPNSGNHVFLSRLSDSEDSVSKERVLINLITETEFREFVSECDRYIELNNWQDDFKESFNATKVLNLVLLNNEVKSLDAKQLLGIDAINSVGRRLSAESHSVVGITHLDNLLNHEDVVINGLYSQPHDSLVKFDKDCNYVSVVISEFHGKVNIESLTF